MSPHGTRTRYNLGSCRCDECRAANTAYAMKRRRALGVAPMKPTKHGTTTMYNKYACRCDACRAANTEAVRKHRLRKRDAA